MKVRCRDVVNPSKGTRFMALTRNTEYVVLSMEFYGDSLFAKSKGDFIIYRIIDDDNLLKPYPASIFEICSNRLSSCWVCYRNKDDAMQVLPQEWAYNGFWEQYYNDEPNALLKFDLAKKQIYSEIDN
ncbi:hypothetical protein SAMN03159341_1422 [Paenibacillus sp. 1_12]|nr:hypothetical protein SAMN03159341_1422 [Paenibacillus sp. 1_12]